MTELSGNALEVAVRRYFENADEGWSGLAERVARTGATTETKEWEEAFYNEINDMTFIPGGRILRNSGKLKQCMLNCACLPISDSIEAIGETIKNSLILWSYGAGIGIDFSTLRYKGAPLVSKGGESSGMVSFLEAIDGVAHTIETGGQRRSGCLAMCRVSHPEIYDFIDAKLEDKTLSYFNLSVAVDNSFLHAVEDDADWDLTFAGQTMKTVRARDLWYKILDSQIRSGEPGIINYNNLIKNNSYYFQQISATNLCGELPLAPYGMCCLGSINLPKFTIGKKTNWKKLETTVYNAVRFLDNIIDVNFYAIKQTETATVESRRIGLGVMGLHDYLINKEVRYGSEKATLEVERLFKFIRDKAYEASVELAREKGTFPKYIRSEYTRASFIKKLPAKIRKDIKKYGIRNTTLLSAQPTGTTSLIADVSSGIEPLFALAYERQDRVSDRFYIHRELASSIEDWLVNNTTKEVKLPEWLVDSSDLTPEDHLEMQATIQKFVDNAVSKTINCPKGMDVETLSKLLFEWLYDVKGVTVYVDGSKEGQVLNRLSIDEAIDRIRDGMKFEIESEVSECISGKCDI